eukprot:5215621-Alexandrium_andersonii.AAC.1
MHHPPGACLGISLWLSSRPILKHRNCVRRSKLELRGPRHDLRIGTEALDGVRSVPLFAQMPNPPTRRAGPHWEDMITIIN